MKYQLFQSPFTNKISVIQHNDDGSSICFDPVNDNTIGEHFRAWLAEGNEPLPALQPETQSEPDSIET
jgi:hypothetical protein